MKTLKHVLPLTIQLSIITIISLSLIFIFQAARTGTFVNATSPAESPTAQGYPPLQTTTPIPPETTTAEPYPPPENTLLPLATIAVTFTPPPQLSVTPLPTQEPPLNAEGFIVYPARNGDTMEFYSLPINADGNPAGLPALVPLGMPLPWLHGESAFLSPNGRHIALLQFVESGDIVRIFDADTGQIAPLFRPNMPAGVGLFRGWHPDSRHVLYRTDGGDPNYGLWLVDTNTSTSIVLVKQNPRDPSSTLGAIYFAAVSPNGQQVVYTLYKNILPASSSELWLINADGSNPQLLHTHGVVFLYPMWSPDGSRIAFIGENGLMVIMADGATPQTLSQNIVSTEYLYRPAWSPDGHTIAFVTFDEPNPLTNGLNPTPMPRGDWHTDAFLGANIHLVDVVTGDEHPLLADGSTGNIDPVWSPDGSQIAFISNRSGTTEMWAVNRDGSNLRQLTNTGQYIRFPLWHRP